MRCGAVRCGAVDSSVALAQRQLVDGCLCVFAARSLSLASCLFSFVCLLLTADPPFRCWLVHHCAFFNACYIKGYYKTLAVEQSQHCQNSILVQRVLMIQTTVNSIPYSRPMTILTDNGWHAENRGRKQQVNMGY